MLPIFSSLKDAPSFLLNVSDFLLDEKLILMDNREAGCYIKLLCFSWREGSIPSAIGDIARLCGETDRSMRRIWAGRLSTCFLESPEDSNRLVNRRIEEERSRLEMSRAAKVDAGRRGGESRWHRHREDGRTEGDRSQSGFSASAPPSAEDKKTPAPFVYVEPETLQESSASDSAEQISQSGEGEFYNESPSAAPSLASNSFGPFSIVDDEPVPASEDEVFNLSGELFAFEDLPLAQKPEVKAVSAAPDVSSSSEPSSPKAKTKRNAPPASEIREVFEHWQSVMGKDRSKMDARREGVIRARLSDGYEVEELKRAIDGCRRSAWHMGQNDTGATYNGLDLIFRSADKVDKFISMGIKARPKLVFDGSGELFRGGADNGPATFDQSASGDVTLQSSQGMPRSSIWDDPEDLDEETKEQFHQNRKECGLARIEVNTWDDILRVNSGRAYA